MYETLFSIQLLNIAYCWIIYIIIIIYTIVNRVIRVCLFKHQTWLYWIVVWSVWPKLDLNVVLINTDINEKLYMNIYVYVHYIHIYYIVNFCKFQFNYYLNYTLNSLYWVGLFGLDITIFKYWNTKGSGG